MTNKRMEMFNHRIVGQVAWSIGILQAIAVALHTYIAWRSIPHVDFKAGIVRDGIRGEHYMRLLDLTFNGWLCLVIFATILAALSSKYRTPIILLLVLVIPTFEYFILVFAPLMIYAH